MRGALAGVLLALGLLVSAPPLARAHNANADIGSVFVERACTRLEMHGVLPAWPKRDARHADTGAAGAALTLLVGSVAVAAGKRRRDP